MQTVNINKNKKFHKCHGNKGEQRLNVLNNLLTIYNKATANIHILLIGNIGMEGTTWVIPSPFPCCFGLPDHKLIKICLNTGRFIALLETIPESPHADAATPLLIVYLILSTAILYPGQLYSCSCADVVPQLKYLFAFPGTNPLLNL